MLTEELPTPTFCPCGGSSDLAAPMRSKYASSGRGTRDMPVTKRGEEKKMK